MEIQENNTLHDVFICHASEDKNDFVRQLAEALQSHHLEVWYDEFTLDVGDSLREAIDKGLATSRFGIVVLSPSFFQKGWPRRELNGLVAREIAEDRHLILPVWHKVEHADVVRFSPPLADLVAASSASGIDSVVNDLLKKLRPLDSPLIVARDFLIDKGVRPPVVTDEWWLDIIEVKEAQFLYPDLNAGWRWIFPLPFRQGDRGRERGLNIAWSALQLDWAVEAEAQKISQLTHPDKVQAFIRQWPGLLECASDNPETLALYAPQLTIPGFDDGFEGPFDEIMALEKTNLCSSSRYGGPDIEGVDHPLCGDFIAWRHPAFGGYAASELSYQFANAHNLSYSRHVNDGFECLVWLLSKGSSWMPEKLKEILLKGLRDRVHWWLAEPSYSGSFTYRALELERKSKFAYTKDLKAELIANCDQALHELSLKEGSDRIVKLFIEFGFFEGWFEEQERWEAAWGGKS